MSALRRKLRIERIRKLFTLLIGFVYLFPMYIAVSNSFKPYGEIINSPLSLPLHATMDNYVEAFRSGNRAVQNSLTAIVMTFAAIAFAIMGAKRRDRW